MPEPTGASYAPDRYKMCAACPVRHQADILEALGQDRQAREMREAGCGWWQEGIPSVDGERGFMAQPTFTGCFKPYLPSYLIALFHQAGHSAAAFNDARNRVLRAIGADPDSAEGRLITMGLVTLTGGSSKQMGRGDEPPGVLPEGELDENC